MQRINRFDATGDLEFDFFATQSFGNFFLNLLHGFFGGEVIFFDNVGKFAVTLWVNVGKGDIGHFNTEAAHV